MVPFRPSGFGLLSDFGLRISAFIPLAPLLLTLHAPSATIAGNLTDISLSLQPLNTKMIFTPTNEVQIGSAGLAAGPPKILDTTAGSFSILLDTGYYTVTLPAVPYRRPFLITVPSTNGTINITNLISQIPYVSTNCMVKVTPWDFVPGLLNQKLDVMGALTKFLIPNFSSGAVTLVISNNPVSGSGVANSLTNENIQIALDGTCAFGLLGTPFHISSGGSFDHLSIGGEGEHTFAGDGSFSLCSGSFTADSAGNLTANALTTPGDIEITDNTKGVILKSPGGNRYRIKVADDGTLSMEALP